MSLMAGIYSLDKRNRPSQSWIDSILRNLSRSNDPVETYQDEHLFLAKIDVGAFDDPAWIQQDFVTTVTGEPLLNTGSDAPNSRAEDVYQVGSELRRGHIDTLRECTGSFSLCFYDPRTHELLVSIDRAGVRAVYYSSSTEFVFFSSNLRILEQIEEIPKRMDVRAVTEIVIFAIPLADRTPFADIKVLRGGQYLRCMPGNYQVSHYFRLDEIQPTRLNREQMQSAAYETFVSAVARRSARDRSSVSFLTGGLDSRVIVATLRNLGKTTFAITFKYPKLLDGPLAQQFAQSIGATQFIWPVRFTDKLSELSVTVPRMIRYERFASPRFPSLVFSGDGGGVGVGYVYMDKRITDLLRQGRLHECIQYHLRRGVLPRRMFKPWIYARIHELAVRGVKEELSRIHVSDPAKAFHIYLLDNDQRRHLHAIYENLDLSRTEFLLPFFDGAFLELLNSAPPDWFLLHEFYYEWLRKFPEPTASVPWQAYPGHLPCPVKTEGNHRPQWQITKRERALPMEPLYKECRRALLDPSFPSKVLNRPGLLAAMTLHQLGLKNYSYLWEICAVFLRYFRRSGGQLVFPDSEEAHTLP